MEHWVKVQDLWHYKTATLVLRIVFQHLPYSYGTTSYCLLQLLTDKGWEDIRVITYTREGKEVMSTEEAIGLAKEYAAFLYSCPSQGESIE